MVNKNQDQLTLLSFWVPAKHSQFHCFFSEKKKEKKLLTQKTKETTAEYKYGHVKMSTFAKIFEALGRESVFPCLPDVFCRESIERKSIDLKLNVVVNGNGLFTHVFTFAHDLHLPNILNMMRCVRSLPIMVYLHMIPLIPRWPPQLDRCGKK